MIDQAGASYPSHGQAIFKTIFGHGVVSTPPPNYKDDIFLEGFYFIDSQTTLLCEFRTFYRMKKYSFFAKLQPF